MHGDEIHVSVERVARDLRRRSGKRDFRFRTRIGKHRIAVRNKIFRRFGKRAVFFIEREIISHKPVGIVEEDHVFGDRSVRKRRFHAQSAYKRGVAVAVCDHGAPIPRDNLRVILFRIGKEHIISGAAARNRSHRIHKAFFRGVVGHEAVFVLVFRRFRFTFDGIFFRNVIYVAEPVVFQHCGSVHSIVLIQIIYAVCRGYLYQRFHAGLFRKHQSEIRKIRFRFVIHVHYGDFSFRKQRIVARHEICSHHDARRKRIRRFAVFVHFQRGIAEFVRGLPFFVGGDIYRIHGRGSGAKPRFERDNVLAERSGDRLIFVYYVRARRISARRFIGSRAVAVENDSRHAELHRAVCEFVGIIRIRIVVGKNDFTARNLPRAAERQRAVRYGVHLDPFAADIVIIL